MDFREETMNGETYLMKGQFDNSTLSGQIKNAKIILEYPKDTLVDDMDTIKFGYYPKDSLNDKAPIDWILLEVNYVKHKALLLSKYNLDYKCYNEEDKIVTWENSSLRQWLNNEFLEKAFNKDEKGMIIKVPIVNKGNYREEYFDEDTALITPGRYIDGGNDTEDRIFLLSSEEMNKYFPEDKIAEENKRASTRGTEYVKNMINYDCENPKGYWWSNNDTFWLRSIGWEYNCATCVTANGHRNDMGIVVNNFLGVRPAMWIKY